MSEMSLTPPVVTIVSISKSKISKIVGMEKTIIKFKFDIDVVDWVVRVSGTSSSTGIYADGSDGNWEVIPANTVLTATVDWTECYREGDNRVNIYGQGIDAAWTFYDYSLGMPEGLTLNITSVGSSIQLPGYKEGTSVETIANTTNVGTIFLTITLTDSQEVFSILLLAGQSMAIPFPYDYYYSLSISGTTVGDSAVIVVTNYYM